MQMEQALQNNGQLPPPTGRHNGPPPSSRPPGPPRGNRTLVNEAPLPEKPTSAEICKFGIGCAVKRCPYSHPSPVATESTGMVLRTESCPDGKGCKDPDCPYSHVSPAQVNGKSATYWCRMTRLISEHVEGTGPAKVLCRFAECTNPNCQYRHEDAEGNVIPPPALTRKLAASSAMKVDGAEGDEGGVAKPIPGKPLNGMIPVPCRFGAGCLNSKCRFTHDNRRPCNFGVRCFKGTCKGLWTRPYADLADAQPTAHSHIHRDANCRVSPCTRNGSRRI